MAGRSDLLRKLSLTFGNFKAGMVMKKKTRQQRPHHRIVVGLGSSRTWIRIYCWMAGRRESVRY